ncbi:hypothetical protein [Paenibacillus harenae]|uniref:hypothetical protein n=1 Tax=Paenibacillus harenae TaxID=306543 RepID=UPI00278D4810|nr:hypothetical protein [Paenibacillus harenae]MDQ0058669.1 hypothetical protein [Paenibacillus harenae]
MKSIAISDEEKRIRVPYVTESRGNGATFAIRHVDGRLGAVEGKPEYARRILR